MLNKSFKIKSVTGKFKKMNFYTGMIIDLVSILDLLEGCEKIHINKYAEGYRIKAEQSGFYILFSELENY